MIFQNFGQKLSILSKLKKIYSMEVGVVLVSCQCRDTGMTLVSFRCCQHCCNTGPSSSNRNLLQLSFQHLSKRNAVFRTALFGNYRARLKKPLKSENRVGSRGPSPLWRAGKNFFFTQNFLKIFLCLSSCLGRLEVKKVRVF